MLTGIDPYTNPYIRNDPNFLGNYFYFLCGKWLAERFDHELFHFIQHSKINALICLVSG